MAPTQTYANHHHVPTQTYVASALWLLSLVFFVLRWFYIGGRVSMALGLGALLGTVLVLISIGRVYITALQDRIIKLEMRVRAASLLTPAQQQLYSGLSKKQIVALRFASDPELGPLVERAARENLTPDQVKREIKVWMPDWDRT